MTVEKLSTLLAEAFDRTRRYRETSPAAVDDPSSFISAHSFEVYPVVMRSEELDAGIYRYVLEDHTLQPVDIDSFDGTDELDTLVRDIAVGQLYVEGAAVTFLFSLCLSRFVDAGFEQQTLRRLYMNMPMHANRLLFVATALGYRTFITPASDDDRADAAVGVDGYDEAVSYILPVGR